MPATAADLKFFAAATQTDTADGGGPRGSTVLQNGTTEVFPAVSAADRTSGRTRIRKVYAGPVNSDNATLLGASLAINEVPTDTAVSVAMFAFGDASTRRAAALNAQIAGQVSVLSEGVDYKGVGSATAGSATVTGLTTSNSAVFASSVGRWMLVIGGPSRGTDFPAIAQRVPNLGARVCLRVLVSITGTDALLNEALPASMAGTVEMWPCSFPNNGSIRFYGEGDTSASAASGDTVVNLVSPHVQIAGPADGGGLASTYEGFGSFTKYSACAGRVPYVLAGDTATLWNEAATTPATYSAGNTVNVGRTDLDQMALVDSAGVEVMRWLAGGPTPTGGFATVNLSTGVLTFVTVAGLAQPCFVRHRIAHRSAVDTVGARTVTLATALTRTFPAGSVLATHLPLGDVQARALNTFGQQAFTNVWSDTLIGSAAPTQYTGAITVTNQGAETDRWALIFTAANAFKLYSERLGLVASGSTTATFAPLNPATGAPYFSLATTGWSSDILVSSVFRFNTTGAAPPVWVVQCIKPSVAAGTTRTALRLHGTVV